MQALIKFTQGVLTGPYGQAVIGVSGVKVQISSIADAEVKSWRIELVDVPPCSLLVEGTLDSNTDDSVPYSKKLIPDVPGCYRIALYVYDGTGYSGNVDLDIRNFAVPEDKRGIIYPPYQMLPDKLPILGSGLDGEKPDELNFNGQEHGWAGSGIGGLIDEVLLRLAASSFDSIPDPSVGEIGNVVLVIQPVLGNARAATTDGRSIFIIDGTDTGAQVIKATKNGYGERFLAYGQQWLNAVYDGKSLWICGRTIPPQTPNIPTVVEITNLLGSMQYGDGGFSNGNWGTTRINDIAFDGSNLWLAGDGDKLTQITRDGDELCQLTPSGDPANGVNAVIYDPDASNYTDGHNRIWAIGNADNSTLYRIDIWETPSVESLLAVDANSAGLAIGGGFVYTGYVDGAEVGIRKIDTDANPLVETSHLDLAAYFTAIGAIEYDTPRGYVIILGKNSDDNPVVVEVNASSMTAVTSKILDTSTNYTVLSTNHFVASSNTTPRGPSDGRSGLGAWLPIGADVNKIFHYHGGDLITSVEIEAIKALEYSDASVSLQHQENIIYVGKHGDDNNSGFNIEEAKLTFSAALSTAEDLTPSSVYIFSIVCLDAGIYEEDVSISPYIFIYAPNATIIGQVSLDGNCGIDISIIMTADINVWDAVYRYTEGQGDSFIKFKAIGLVDGATGAAIKNRSENGKLYINGSLVFVDSAEGSCTCIGGGEGYGGSPGNLGDIIGHVDEIRLGGTYYSNYGIVGNAGAITIDVNKITETGKYSTAIYFVDAATVHVRAISIESTVAYELFAGCTLYLDCPDIQGEGYTADNARVIGPVSDIKVIVDYTMLGDTNIGLPFCCGVTMIKLKILQNFDGNDPVLIIGDSNTPNCLVDEDQIDLTGSLDSEDSSILCAYTYDTAMQIVANLSTGGYPSQGAVEITLCRDPYVGEPGD